VLAAADEQLPDVSGWDGSPFESPTCQCWCGESGWTMRSTFPLDEKSRKGRNLAANPSWPNTYGSSLRD
jgi:hypothetical protein